MDLAAIWFFLLGAMLAGYAVLDGFDLGVGILHPFARGDAERRMFISAIGPVWDGNEVWLVVFAGALFAAFPEAYATTFSAFYPVVMLVLAALIVRAASIEFRTKRHSAAWRGSWDGGFFASSLLAAFLFGLAAGNAMIGIRLDARGAFIDASSELFGPYPILIGLLAVATFAMHGALYLNLKAPHGNLHDRIGRWIWHSWGVFLVLYVLTTNYTLIAVSGSAANLHRWPASATLVVLNVLAIANIPRAAFHERPRQAFASSCAAIATLVGLLGLALWPNLVADRNDPARSLTIHRAASSHLTLVVMLIIACIGTPLVLTYTAIIYWTFRRRVTTDGQGY